MTIWQSIKILFSRIWNSPVDGEGTGTEVPVIIRDAKGWAYYRDDVRERYEAECG